MIDFSGLTQPITKLIEVIAAGIGEVYEPYKMKRLADAKAYQIERIAAAINENKGADAKVEYKSEDIVITKVENNSTSQDVEQSVADRALARFAYQQAKKQINIELITGHAAEELRREKTVSEDPLDNDWIGRFFSIAENITSDDMQILWGKILAGEVKNPGSYSLRTMELLKNISQNDAEIFTKVSQLAFYVGGKAFILNPDHAPQIAAKLDIKFVDLLLLRELGLISEDLTYTMNHTSENTSTLFLHGDKCIIIERRAGSTQQQLEVLKFTRIGEELLSLIEVSANIEYTHKLASLLRQKNTTIKMADFLFNDGKLIHHTNVQVI